MRRIKRGDRVLVKGFQKSAQKYGYASRMEEMTGKTYTSAVSLEDDAQCIHINGIFMSIEDVDLPDFEVKELEPKIFLFDESLIKGESSHGQKTRTKIS